MEFFNEKEQNLIKIMCPSCKDLYEILEKAYDKQEYMLTEEQIYNLNHACFDFELLKVGDIIKNINNNNITNISEIVVNQLNKGEHCPVLEMLGRMGDCFEMVVKSLKIDNKNEFDFNKFVELGKYSGIQYANIENEAEKLYEYIGDDRYLYYNVFIPYNDDYVFSYNTTIVGSVVVRFYDNEKNNISSEVINLINEGAFDEAINGIVKEDIKIEIPYVEGTNISYFTVGFEVEEESYFSDLVLERK